MQPEEPGTQQPEALLVATSWQATRCLGVVTLILGLIVSFRTSGWLNVIAVLLGIVMIIAGMFHVVRVFDGREAHRCWLGIAGLLFIVIGVILIRHVHLTLAIIGLMVGIVWIVQGVVSLIAGLSGGSRQGRGWWIFFGLVSLIAGIVVASAPVTSLTVLATLLGIWFAVIGAFEIIRAFLLRHLAAAAKRDLVNT